MFEPRRSAEFQWFFTALSVRPGRYLHARRAGRARVRARDGTVAGGWREWVGAFVRTWRCRPTCCQTSGGARAASGPPAASCTRARARSLRRPRPHTPLAPPAARAVPSAPRVLAYIVVEVVVPALSTLLTSPARQVLRHQRPRPCSMCLHKLSHERVLRIGPLLALRAGGAGLRWQLIGRGLETVHPHEHYPSVQRGRRDQRRGAASGGSFAGLVLLFSRSSRFLTPTPSPTAVLGVELALYGPTVALHVVRCARGHACSEQLHCPSGLRGGRSAGARARVTREWRAIESAWRIGRLSRTAPLASAPPHTACS